MEAWDDNRLTLAAVKTKLLEEWERKKDHQAVAFRVTIGPKQNHLLFLSKRRTPQTRLHFLQKFKERARNGE